MELSQNQFNAKDAEARRCKGKSGLFGLPVKIRVFSPDKIIKIIKIFCVFAALPLCVKISHLN
jgi:hypothetical protein